MMSRVIEVLRRNRRSFLTAAIVGGGYSLYALNSSNVISSLYKQLPLNSISRLWGRMHELQLPNFAKPLVLNAYVKMFGCKMDEAILQDVKQYANLAELFRRRLRPDMRPVDQKAAVVSPCDGVVVDHGKVDHQGQTMKVKGHLISIATFLGLSSLPSTDENRALHYCVLYLAPGDYHGFHSPVRLEISQRRHFDSGLLLSVSDLILNRVNDVFLANERAIYEGQWKQGYFAMAAVGATNVGSIKIAFDPDLVTNRPSSRRSSFGTSSSMDLLTFERSVVLEKGADFGEFNLGSSIVLVFEADHEDLEMKVNLGQKVKFGQALYSIRAKQNVNSSDNISSN